MARNPEIQQCFDKKNVKELAALYEVGAKTFKAWLSPYLHEIGPKLGRCYTPRQVIIIYKKLGPPKSMPIPEDILNKMYEAYF